MRKKYGILAAGVMLLFCLAFAGCKEKEPTIDDKEIFEEDLQPLDEEELEAMENVTEGDEEMSVLDEEELEELGDIVEEEELDAENSGGIKVEEEKTYSTKQEVAVYLHNFGHLPSNYLTKAEAEELGWKESEDNLGEVAPGKNIGGDVYENEDGMFPKEEGRTYQQCDVDTKDGKRGEARLIYSNDGLIFYSSDLFETYEQVY